MTGSIHAEAPASQTVLGSEQLRSLPGINLDDRLRSVPGFTLFRRTSSLVAHPTTQGVSLRGIGPTGASRTLVLWDGVPANDPFGGWVYWTRFPPEDIERVEVTRGASTSVFGDRAMGGSIGLFSREPEPLHFSVFWEPGSDNSHLAGASFSQLTNRWGLTVNGRGYTTDGYPLIRESERGAVDVPAFVRFAAGSALFDILGRKDRLALKLDVLAEERGNGTPLQHNSTSLGSVSANYAHQFSQDSLNLVAYHTREQFHSSFTSIAADRNSERLTRLQTVPAEGTGGAAMWRHDRSGWSLLAGSDARYVSGWSEERGFPSGGGRYGGHLLQQGSFVQGQVRLGRVDLFAGGRHDFTGLGNQFFSPSAGVTVGAGRWRIRATAYRAFRAPTLNELYRGFRQGNTVTEANADLHQETAWGAETGFDLVGESRRLSVTAYHTGLDGLITNVTQSVSPTLIVRQRENAGKAVSRGIEARLQQRWRLMQAELSYLFADARFDNGARLPEVARHQGTARIIFARGGTLASAGVRAYSMQFDDDLNQQVLGGFALLEFSARQRLVRGFSATLEVENALNRVYAAALTPAMQTGAPRLWRAGLRWEWPTY